MVHAGRFLRAGDSPVDHRDVEETLRRWGIMEIPELDPDEIPSKPKAPNLPEGCMPVDLMKRVKDLELRNTVLGESLRALEAEGFYDMTNAEKVVRRLLSEEDLVVPREWTAKQFTTYVGEISEVPPNLIRRDFHADALKEKWLTDITEMKEADRKVYLSPIIDCFDGVVVARKAGTNSSAELTSPMPKEACSTLTAQSGPVLRNDRGSHYRQDGRITICEEHNLVRSMSRKGCTPDNSACEGFIGRIKNESYCVDHWSRMGCADLIAAVDDRIERYGNSRIKESLGSMSPVEYRRLLGLMEG